MGASRLANHSQRCKSDTFGEPLWTHSCAILTLHSVIPYHGIFQQAPGALAPSRELRSRYTDPNPVAESLVFRPANYPEAPSFPPARSDCRVHRRPAPRLEAFVEQTVQAQLWWARTDQNPKTINSPTNARSAGQNQGLS